MDALERNAAVAAAPRPMPLGGRTLLVSPPTDADMMAITLQSSRRAASPLARVASDPSFGLLLQRHQDIAVTEAARAQAGVTAREPDPADVLASFVHPDVLSFAVWLCARRNHPGLRLEDVRKDVTDDNAVEVFVEFNEASGMAALGNSGGRPGSPGGQTAPTSTAG